MKRRCFAADIADDEQNIETRGVEARKVGRTRRDTSLVTLLKNRETPKTDVVERTNHRKQSSKEDYLYSYTDIN
jgi:hypothetical protein